RRLTHARPRLVLTRSPPIPNARTATAVPLQKGSAHSKNSVAASFSRLNIRQSVGYMEKKVDRPFTLFYLAIEGECDICRGRFAEPEGGDEAGIREWAQRTAAAAYRVGWRDAGDRPLCPDCISHHAHTAAE